MKIATIKDLSLVDGEGTRLVIFTTGCVHNCDGCHNKLWQNYNMGYDITSEEIISYIKERKAWIDGITISGGDPLFQLNETKKLLREIRMDPELKKLNIWLYTGYLFEQIPKQIKKDVDVIIDGKYDKQLPVYDPVTNSLYKKWRGSTNQRLCRKQEDTSWTFE